MIQGFATRETELFFQGGSCPAKWCAVSSVAIRKLDMVDAAVTLDDLRSPPGNRLEALKGDRAGQYSIRINDRWRVCFVWTARGPEQVEIVDYH
ncbi:plasmid maintenance system killer protein [Beijerinckiaceae bacterium]|nr:plasmid maintenance system killer protein [Beijerinckiaceae bacterium]